AVLLRAHGLHCDRRSVDGGGERTVLGVLTVSSRWSVVGSQELERDLDPEMQRPRRLDGGGRPRRWSADREFLDLERRIQKVEHVDGRDQLVAADRDRLMISRVERVDEREPRLAVA